MTTPYKTAALRYWTHGWEGPLPVGSKPQQKTHPPTGYTGSEGAWPDEDQIIEWSESRPNVNIALRLPKTVIGIDVDDYDDKPGADTMIATTEAHDRLPRTWISTSRSGRSGIRWFTLPTPAVLPGKLVHPDDPDVSGVEVIQYHHRYAVVWPSVHPSGDEYRWVTPDGEIVTDGTLPTPDAFPAIPQAWLDHINQDCSCWAPFRWDKYETQPNDPVKAAYDKWRAKMTASYGRHDAALGGVMALVAFKERGWPGATHYLEQLESDFKTSLGDSRTAGEADAEWDRMLEGAEKKSSTSSIPIWEPHQTSSVPSPETFDARVEQELDKLRVRDTARRQFIQETTPPQPVPAIRTLRERLANPLPDVAWRIEGWQPMGTRVMLAAQFKAGKTTLTGNLARCLVDDQQWLNAAAVAPVLSGHVTVLDIEMSERQIDGWLADQGIENDNRIVVAPLRGRAGSFNILDDTVRKEWASRLEGTEYLILDCLRPILDALGLDEHKEGGRFLTALDALCDQAKIADTLVVHHMGHLGERSRGDSRFRDWPDVEWRLVRETEEPDSPRYISAYGRDVEQGEALIEHDPATRHISLIGGNRHTAAARAAIPAVLDYVRDNPKVAKSYVEKALSEHGQKTIRDAMDIAYTNGQLLLEHGPRGSHLLSIPVSSSARSSSSDDLTNSSAPIGADEFVTMFEGADLVGDQEPTTEEIAP